MKLFSTSSIKQVPAPGRDVFAFRLSGKFSDNDMEALAMIMNGAFDKADREAVWRFVRSCTAVHTRKVA